MASYVCPIYQTEQRLIRVSTQHEEEDLLSKKCCVMYFLGELLATRRLPATTVTP